MASYAKYIAAFLGLSFSLMSEKGNALRYPRKIYSDMGSCNLSGQNFVHLQYAQKSDQGFQVGWSQFSRWKIPAYHKPYVGGAIHILRCIAPGHFVNVGRGYVTSFNGSTVEAEVVSKKYQPVHFGRVSVRNGFKEHILYRPMVNDIVIPVDEQIIQKIQMNPKVVLDTAQLFKRTSENEFSFEISLEGEKLIKENMELFRGLGGRFLVEGFTLRTGDRKLLRRDSLLRARAVTHFIQRTYGINTDMITAIGYGNDWYQSIQKDQYHNGHAMTEGIRLELIPR